MSNLGDWRKKPTLTTSRARPGQMTSLRAFGDDCDSVDDRRPLAPPKRKRNLTRESSDGDYHQHQETANTGHQQQHCQQQQQRQASPSESTGNNFYNNNYTAGTATHTSISSVQEKELKPAGNTTAAVLPGAVRVLPDECSTQASYIFRDDDDQTSVSYSRTVDSVQFLKEELGLVLDRRNSSSLKSLQSSHNGDETNNNKSDTASIISIISGARVPPKFRPQLVTYVNGPGAVAVQNNNSSMLASTNEEQQRVLPESAVADARGTDIESNSMPRPRLGMIDSGMTLSVAEIVLDESEIEDAVRERIMKESVQAEIVEPQKRVPPFYLWLAKWGWLAFMCLAIATGIVVAWVFEKAPLPSDPPTLSPTPVPSMMPTTAEFYQRQENFANLLKPLSGDRLWEVNSPQNRAFEWIVDVDSARLDPLAVPEFEIQQRYILMVLYFATEGPKWTDQSNFTSEYHYCQWNGDSEAVGSLGVTCNKDMNVIKLDTTENNLQGTLPPEVGYLTELIELDANTNHLRGTVPETLGNLTALRRLDADYNQITGSLPSSLFEIQTLKLLWFDRNMLTGTLPSNIGNAQSLESLALEDNLLTSTIPESISTLQWLNRLSFNGNYLSGPLPSFANTSKLTRLYLREGNYTGTIPKSWGDLTSLQQLSLTKSQVSGTIPTEVAALSNLNQIDISNNLMLTGSIPSFRSMGVDLEYVQLYGNRLSGNLGAFFVNGSNRLRHFDAESNLLTGTIPREIQQYQSLETLILADNLISGAIPTAMGQLTNLNGALHLYSNRLAGTIPTELGLLVRLKELSLSNNYLTGTIASELGMCSQLFLLFLNYNSLTGTVPEEVANLPGLVYTFVHGNQLQDDFRETFCARRTPVDRLGADCLSEDVECPCCTYCCDPSAEQCQEIVP